MENGKWILILMENGSWALRKSGTSGTISGPSLLGLSRNLVKVRLESESDSGV